MTKTIAKDTGTPPQGATFETQIGEGGELHQIASGDGDVLTTQQGIPVFDDQNSLKVGDRGGAAESGARAGNDRGLACQVDVHGWSFAGDCRGLTRALRHFSLLTPSPAILLICVKSSFPVQLLARPARCGS